MKTTIRSRRGSMTEFNQEFNKYKQILTERQNTLQRLRTSYIDRVLFPLNNPKVLESKLKDLKIRIQQQRLPKAKQLYYENYINTQRSFRNSTMSSRLIRSNSQPEMIGRCLVIRRI